MELSATQELERLKEEGKLPSGVRSWRVERGTDWLDRPAVWVWLVVDQNGLERGESGAVRELVRETVRRNTPDAEWVYVGFTDDEDGVRA